MRAHWQSLYSGLLQATNTYRFRQQFELVRNAHRSLLRFRHSTDLLDHLHTPHHGRDGKNAILEALIGATQARQETSEPAAKLLWLGMWPGLDALYRRLLPHFQAAPEELVSEISERFTNEIHRIDPRRVHRIAATLLRNTERDIRQSLRARWSEAEVVRQLPEVGADVVEAALLGPGPGQPSLLGVPPWLGMEAVTPMLTRTLQACPGVDAGLVMAVSVHGYSQAEAGARYGLDPEAARKRYQRSIRRLRQEICAFV